jgi:N-acetylmuramoyl-L-alanine amidase
MEQSKEEMNIKEPFLIILGTAHGSNTPGKRSPDGKLREYSYSREIVSRVERALKEKGYEVTVDLRQDYEPSLTFRVQAVNNLCKKYGAKNTCYVSIHVNAAGMGDKWMNASYWTVWTSRGQTRGDKLAASIWQAAKSLMPERMPVKADWRDGDADYESNFTVLAKTNCAAALTENLFQDNKEDVEWLLSEEGKKTITDIHVLGSENYIKSLSL